MRVYAEPSFFYLFGRVEDENVSLAKVYNAVIHVNSFLRNEPCITFSSDELKHASLNIMKLPKLSKTDYIRHVSSGYSYSVINELFKNALYIENTGAILIRPKLEESEEYPFTIGEHRESIENAIYYCDYNEHVDNFVDSWNFIVDQVQLVQKINENNKNKL